MYGRYCVAVKPVIVDREKERAEQLKVMLEANYNTAEEYKKLKAKQFTTADAAQNAELKTQITTMEDALIAKYPDFLEHQKQYPNAFTRQGSFSN